MTSRNFVLPATPQAMAEGYWFNMWTKRLWPYRELEAGDVLFWYESPTKTVRWRSRVRAVVRFEYANKREAAARIVAESGPFDQGQPYFVDAPNSGYCLAWNVVGVKQINLPRPEQFRFGQSGWMRIEELANVWPELVAAART